jgi:DNA ligase-associated metallophosphoesterase
VFPNSIDIVFADQHFTLLKERVAYWHKHKMLLIADVHAGKASHFRNNGIPLSTDYLLNDLHTIQTLQQRLNPTKICFLGDLYHTLSNEENLLTDQFLNDLESEIELVIGNHDRHSIRHSTIKCTEAYELDGILLSHEPEETSSPNIYGHLHPAYSIGGKGRQSIKMPCFYVGEKKLVLPAFGSLNGGRIYKNLVKSSQIILTSKDGLITV